MAYCDGIIRKNFIRYNEAVYGGGLSRCYGTIVQNFVTNNDASNRGGGMYACTNAIITGNIVFENTAVYGGGIGWTSSALIEHNTIYKNDSDKWGGGLRDCNSANGTIRNNIIWGNTKGGSTPSQVSPTSTVITYSCVEGSQLWPGAGNIKTDPDFVSTTFTGSNMDAFLHLKATSPCIDKTDMDDTDGTFRDFDDQMGPLDGNPVIVGIKRDMGADEFPQPQASSFWWENF